tara:strand:- start:368 stop:592 length:225 start_codon:yes stop_codon:yes gene_type:complete
MNERIKQLALEAGLVRNGDFGMKRWEGPRSDSISDQDLEKFAELIVRQCADIADSIGEHGYIASEEMLEQFGVK